MSSKGFLWSFVFFLTAAIYGSIPTHLIFNYWEWLNTLKFDGQPIYTLLLFVLFLWIVALIITIIYIVAMIRAIVQRKNDSSGIPKGVYRYATVSTVIVIGYMVVWFILFNQIAFFSMLPP
ncbi:MAG: hypothetical protein ACTSO6_12975 [Promethearchaeota archaeon]